MKVIKRKGAIKAIKSSIATLGNFDGCHLGHQKILKTLSKRGKTLGNTTVVYTFEPHPLKIIAPEKSPLLITDIKEKIRLIASFGIDYLVFARFTKEFASLHPEEFVKKVLVNDLSVKEVLVGHDYSFGKGRAGTIEHLKELGKKFGFRVFVIPAYRKSGSIVSSSLIRELIKKGKVSDAAALLGRPFSVFGKVVKGALRGQALGFPTANMKTEGELIPKSGVYAGYAFLNDKRYKSVINIGMAPTFGRTKCVVEAHLLDFSGSIYGKDIVAAFVKRLRDELHFDSAEKLKEKIKKDISKAKKMLKR